MASSTPNQQAGRLSRAVLLLGLLFWLPIYGVRALIAIWQELGPSSVTNTPPGLSGGLALLTWPLALLWSSRAFLVLLSVTSLILGLIALLRERPTQRIRVLLILLLVGVVALPWLYHYKPALEAAPGYKMQLLTQPGVLDGVVKSFQVMAERRPCTYTLLGWDREQHFYFKALCADDPPQVWSVALAEPQRARQIEMVPAELMGTRTPSWARDWVQVAPGMKLEAVFGDSIASPDGQWLAVVARHFYGPEDVLLLSPLTGR